MSERIKMGNQRLKILYLYKILLEKTDENHSISMPEIIAELERFGIIAGRKAIYEDIEALRLYGLDIVSNKGKNAGYNVISRDFELPELKLLADAVSSARFLTDTKSAKLLKKIEGLCSVHEGKEIQRQVYVANRAKSINERIYLNVDKIHKAINEQKQIEFKYFDYDLKKQKKYRDGMRRCSPYALTWDDEKYYLIANYEKYSDEFTNFRVDRMDDVKIIENSEYKALKDFDMSDYINSTFSMFSGKTQSVKLRFTNNLINVVIDRFGKDVIIIPDGDEHFMVRVNVKAEPTFFGWLFMFGKNAEILEPNSVREEFFKQLTEVADMMNNS